MDRRNARRPARFALNAPRAACSLLPLVAAGLLAVPAAARPPAGTAAATVLPVASGNPARPFVYSGSGSQATDGRTMTVTQTTRTLGLNWDRFNIENGYTVRFVQPDAGARVLNRIWDADPSIINGALSANGQVYLINRNGILFGNGAQVNVGGLVASALAAGDGLLDKGLPVARGDALRFAWDGDVTGFRAGFVAVDPGAAIRTPAGGRVLLLAPALAENRGSIQTGKDGETILAAGGSVLLTLPDDPNLRGLWVQVSSFSGKDPAGNALVLGGTASNQGGAAIEAVDGGVVTLAALAVNQSGVVRAGKAVNLDGDIMLVATPPETPRLTLQQGGKTAQIDWTGGFAPVDRDHTVEFVQPDAGATVFNFINDPSRAAAGSGERTRIDGTLKANGQVFLINDKGIDFGAGARVAAGNFVASALGMNPDLVGSGLLSLDGYGKRAFFLSKAQYTAADEAEYAARSAEARSAFAAATVTVARGATISAGDDGYAMLFGSAVDQAGTVIAPKGQVLLAAGADIYLKAPYSAAMRGFTAEVDPLYVARTWDGNRWGVLDHGVITNRGLLSAPLGDVSLTAYTLNQAGTVSATTSVTANGSIHLTARDQVAQSGLAASDTGEMSLAATDRELDDQGRVLAWAGEPKTANTSAVLPGIAGGRLTLAAGSVTEVALDGSSRRTTTADQSFVASSIEAVAKYVSIEGASGPLAGAVVRAAGGNIRVATRETFAATNAFAIDPGTADSLAAAPPAGVGIFIGGGARLDVAGAVAARSVADLFIDVELRGDEFAGDPVQRFGALRGLEAKVDVRDPVTIADLGGWIGKIGQTVEEKAGKGGAISLRTAGSIVVKPDATLDVSGGRTDYAAAQVAESRALTRSGISYRLNDASSSLNYTGLVTVTRQEAGYSEGRSAGSVELNGHDIALGGRLVGTTTPGPRQRSLGNPDSDRHARPYGAQLVVRDAGQHFTPASHDGAAESEAYDKAQIVFVPGRSAAADMLLAGDSAGPVLEIPASVADAGFSRFDIASDGRISLPAGVALNLGPGGSFKAAGRQVYLGGEINAPSGAIAVTTLDRSLTGGPSEAAYSTLVVDRGASLSTAGTWVNDLIGPGTAPLTTGGGSIALTSAYDLDIRPGSRLDVSGGAQVGGAGKLAAGNAGSITLTTGAFGLADASLQRDAGLFLRGTLAAYALGKGGTLDVSTSKVALGTSFATDSRDWSRSERLAAGQVGAAFAASFLDAGGFYDFKFAGYDGVSAVSATRLLPKPLNWTMAGTAYRNAATGARLGDLAHLATLAPASRPSATTITLTAGGVERGDITVDAGAYLGVDPLGAITLQSSRQLTVLGTLEAPAGQILLSRPATPDNSGVSYDVARQSRSIYLGSDARLLASGTTKPDGTTQAYRDAGLSADALRAAGLYRGQVLSGGTVTLDAGLGYLITRDGSLIDVAGAADSLNLPTATGRLSYATRTVGSTGGRVLMSARDGMMLDGSFAAGGGAGSAAGIFDLRFADTRGIGDPWRVDTLAAGAEKTALTGPRRLTLYVSAGDHVATWPGLDETAYLGGTANLATADHNGRASLDLGLLARAGFGSWYLGSQNEIRFSGPVSAKVPQQLRLDAPVFSAAGDTTTVALTAAAAQMGNHGAGDTQAAAAAAAAAAGAAAFSLAARDLGLVGNFVLNGFGNTRLASTGEIHFDSMPNGSANRTGGSLYNGLLKGSGRLEFSAARLSPATFSDFTVDMGSGFIGIRQAGKAEGALLTAGGRLEFKAGEMVHQGTVAAPLGQIAFTATAGGSVTLGEDSVTTVAASGPALLGQTADSGRSWIYDASFRNTADGGLGSVIYTVSAPEKRISVDAAHSTVKAGARIDVSGGGEALAWEFTPGTTGKSDVLLPTATAEPGIFAILPAWGGRFAPADSQNQAYYNLSAPRSSGGTTVYSGVPSLQAGDQIHLEAASLGLAGNYTLLPARYALLPGAWLVSVRSARPSVIGNPQTQADGSVLVAGTRVAAGVDGADAAYGTTPLTLELASRQVTLRRARYDLTTASGFFYDAAGANLPGDAGRLSVVGRESLAFNPTVNAAHAESIDAGDGRRRAARGAEIDLAALRLAVTDGTDPGAGWTGVDRNLLNGLGASSLLLGGTRTGSGDAQSIGTVAESLRIDLSGGEALRGPELLFTAEGDLTVAAGSRIEATTAVDTPSRYVLSGDGAFLRVAAGAQATLERQGSVDRVTGDLRIEAGPVVAGRPSAALTGHSLILDATRGNTVAAAAIDLRNSGQTKADGGSVAMGAGRINVVGDASTPADGLTLTSADLAGLGNPDQVRLTSYSTLDLYGAASLGSSSLRELVLAAAGIAGHGAGSDTARIRAGSVRLENPNPAAAAFVAGSSLGSGALAVEADTIVIGANATAAQRSAGTAGFAIRGFAEVGLTAAKELRFEGTGVTRVDNDAAYGGSGAMAGFAIDAGRVAVASGADHFVAASGAGRVLGGGNGTGTQGLGGALEFDARTLAVGGRIEAPGGRLTLAATGTGASDDLTISGRLLADGTAVAFSDTRAYAPAGKIVLASAAGNVSVATGAWLSVAGAAGGGDAGSVSLRAPNGTVSAAAGTLSGSGGSDTARPGDLAVDARSVSLDGLADAVVAGGTRGFTNSWTVRARTGDLALSAGRTIAAGQVALASDDGSIAIGGTVDASGLKGGTIDLFANRGASGGGRIDLAAGSALLARAAQSVATGDGTAGRGGQVVIGVGATDAAHEADTAIRFAGAEAGKAAALIDVSNPAGSSGAAGRVVFRAPRQDVAATALKTLANAALKRTDTVTVVTATGTATAFSVASTMASYQAGMLVAFQAPAANAGGLTLNVNGKGARDVVDASGSPLAAGALQAGQVVVAVYDGTAFRVNATGLQDTGTAAAYKVTPTAVPTLSPGLQVTFRARNASAANPTLTLWDAVSGKAAATLSLVNSDGTAFAAGGVAKDQLVTAIYDSVTNRFRVVKDTALVARVYSGSNLPGTVQLAGNVAGAGLVALDAVRTTRVAGNYTLGSPQEAVLLAETAQAAANASSLLASADPGGRLGAVFRPGLDLRATGDIAVTGDWDLGAARYGGQPGTLGLRAQGNLSLNASLSDGFTAVGTYGAASRDARIAASGASWSFQLVAGADPTAADPLAVLPTAGAAGTLQLARNVLVRSGTGSVDMAAQGEIKLADGATVYTAGVADRVVADAGAADPALAYWPNGFLPIGGSPAGAPYSVASSDTDPNGERSYFPTGGGDIRIAAGGSITQASQGTIGDWLVRYSTRYDDTQWYPRIASFRNGFATLGGGDLRVAAGGDISGLTAALPTNGRVPGVAGQARSDLALVNGGGDLSVLAQGSIKGGTFYVEQGRLSLEAGAAVTSSGTGTASLQVALGDAQARVLARQGIAVYDIFNPLATRPFYKNSSGAGFSNGVLRSTAAALDYRPAILTYTDDTEVDFLTTGGGASIASQHVVPSRLRVAALDPASGGVTIGGFSQAPGSRGQLDVLAGAGVQLNGGITQYDIPADQLPSMANPVASTNVAFPFLGYSTLQQKYPSVAHGSTLWHAADAEPSRIVALAGDISGPGKTDVLVRFDEPAQILAAGDISGGVSVVTQHLSADDVTTIRAGGSIVFRTNTAATTVFQVDGPGRLEVIAGRDVDLGSGKGIVTRGNLENPNLPAGGASVSVLAGTTAPEYAGFVRYAATADPDFAAVLAAFVDRHPEYRIGVRPEHADAALAQDEAALASMPEALKAPFLRREFFSLLRADGREAVAGGGIPSYAKGRAAAAALFPDGTWGQGNIDLFYSQIKTEQGGDVDLLAPGGGVTVGLANPVAAYAKKASEQGLFTIRGGAIRAYLRDSFLVNQSRVFTLDGGDILVWADRGNIDAGNGAKTVSATPPPALVIRDGQVVLDTSNSVAGSGIGVLASRDTTPASDMDLFAPQGAIDAGDAGLRSTGSINLGAQTILNANNIQAAGTVGGAPAVVAPPTPVAPPGTPANNQKAADGQAAQTAAAQKPPGILTVEIIGLGDDDAAPSPPRDDQDARKEKRR